MKLGNKEIKEKKEILSEIVSKQEPTEEQMDLLNKIQKNKDFIKKKG